MTGPPDEAPDGAFDDTPAGETGDDLCFATPIPTVLLAAGGAVFLSVLAVDVDPMGRLLLVVVSILLAGLGLFGAVVRPVVAAGPDGIDLARGWRHEHVPWSSVRSVSAGESRRLLITRWLEIEIGSDGAGPGPGPADSDTDGDPDADRLVTIGGWRLDRPPNEVARALEQAHPQPPSIEG